MNKPLKYSLIGMAGLLFLVIAAAVVFLLTFDANKYKPQIERLVQEKTGRTLKLQGPLQAAIWPSLGARVSGVATRAIRCSSTPMTGRSTTRSGASTAGRWTWPARSRR